MNKLMPVLSILLISACATYKVESLPNSKFDDSARNLASVGELEFRLSVEKISTPYPQGFQCFEPMLYVVTLGIVPVHCVEEYSASLSSSSVDGSDLVREYKVSIIGGWLALLLAPLPKWKFGDGEEMDREIESQILERAK